MELRPSNPVAARGPIPLGADRGALAHPGDLARDRRGDQARYVGVPSSPQPTSYELITIRKALAHGLSESDMDNDVLLSMDRQNFGPVVLAEHKIETTKVVCIAALL